MKPLGLVALSPGEVHMESVRLDSWQWQSFDCESPFQAGMTCLLSANFDTRGVLEQVPLLKKQKKEVWQGVVASNGFEIRFRQ